MRTIDIVVDPPGAGWATAVHRANLGARTFWRRWFAPACFSFERHVGDRLVPGGTP